MSPPQRNGAGGLHDLVDAEADHALGARKLGGRLRGPVDLEMSRQLEGGAGLEVEEEDPCGRVHGGVAKRVEHLVPRIVAPGELARPGHSYEPRRTATMGCVGACLGMQRSEKERLGTLDPAALVGIQLDARASRRRERGSIGSRLVRVNVLRAVPERFLHVDGDALTDGLHGPVHAGATAGGEVDGHDSDRDSGANGRCDGSIRAELGGDGQTRAVFGDIDEARRSGKDGDPDVLVGSCSGENNEAARGEELACRWRDRFSDEAPYSAGVSENTGPFLNEKLTLVETHRGLPSGPPAALQLNRSDRSFKDTTGSESWGCPCCGCRAGTWARERLGRGRDCRWLSRKDSRLSKPRRGLLGI